jgi:4-hydroxybenzoate polyprenyltransferase
MPVKLRAVIALLRLDKPVGILLLLWPCMWSLTLAAQGWPQLQLVLIFVLGAIVMRSAGCVMNDIADSKIDQQVTRTRLRPLASGKLSIISALSLMCLLLVLGLSLVLLTNSLTLLVACVALLLIIVYPFTKRFFVLPQLVLGTAFACGVPMAFAAQLGYIPVLAWYLFVLVIIFTLMYDTIYALCDFEDDAYIGVHSSARFFGRAVKPIIVLLQCCVVLMWLGLLVMYSVLEIYTIVSLLLVVLLFMYQYYLMRQGVASKYLAAFANNALVGALLWLGLVLQF